LLRCRRPFSSKLRAAFIVLCELSAVVVLLSLVTGDAQPTGLFTGYVFMACVLNFAAGYALTELRFLRPKLILDAVPCRLLDVVLGQRPGCARDVHIMLSSLNVTQG
jgi:hypothetical protein